MAAYIAAVSTFPWEPLMRVVHVRIARADLAKSLGEMREWLDRHKTPLVRFGTEMHRGTIMIKIQLDRDDLAEQFRKAFRGSYVD
jgi:hypothetical protein